MADQVLIIIAIVLFVVVGLMAKDRKAATIEGFSTRRNRLNWFVVAAGASMTFVGGAALLNMASLGYSYRWDTLVDPITFMTGIIIAAFYVNRYRDDTGITISQLLSGSNKKLSLYIGVITSVIFLMVISAQFVALSKLLAPFFPGVNTVLLVIIPPGIILLYVFLGGFAAVTNTDVLQLFFIFIFLLIPVGYYLVTTETAIPFQVSQKDRFAPMPGELMIYFFIFALFIPLSQDINIRAKSAKNVRHARTGIISGGTFYGIIVIACIYIGITLAENGVILADSEQAFPIFFKHYYPTFGIFPILAGMAAVWSTLDTYLVNCIASVAHDIFKKSNYLNNCEDRTLIILAGILIFSIATFLSIYFNEVLSLILTALLVYVSVLIPIVIGKKIKMSDNIIFFTSLLTVIAIILCEALNIKVNPKAVIYPACSVLLMVAGRIYQNVAVNK